MQSGYATTTPASNTTDNLTRAMSWALSFPSPVSAQAPATSQLQSSPSYTPRPPSARRSSRENIDPAKPSGAGGAHPAKGKAPAPLGLSWSSEGRTYEI